MGRCIGTASAGGRTPSSAALESSALPLLEGKLVLVCAMVVFGVHWSLMIQCLASVRVSNLGPMSAIIMAYRIVSNQKA